MSRPEIVVFHTQGHVRLEKTVLSLVDSTEGPEIF